MPTPNQTTPDSPERARGETPRADNMVLPITQDIIVSIAYLPVVRADFARQLERELNASQAETTRLAEALKEAREHFENIVRDRAERDKVLITANSGIYIIATSLTQPAPISGAKKE